MIINTLEIDYFFDFHLIGIRSQLKEYKMAWWLNSILRISFVKEKDLEYDFGNEGMIEISYFSYQTSHQCFRLLKNKPYFISSHILIDSLPQYDYFLVIEDDTNTLHIQKLLSRLRKISGIDRIKWIDANKLPEKENFIF